MVEPGTAISVSVRFGRLFYMRLTQHDISFAGIELNHVARPVENLRVISLNTVSVYRPSVSKLAV